MFSTTVKLEIWDECTIGDHGEHKQLWFVRQKDGWQPVAAFPRAQLEEEGTDELGDDDARPPGTVWCRRYALDLPQGTVLRKFESWPRVVRLPVMEYLKRGLTRMPRAERNRYYRLTGPYRLELMPELTSPAPTAGGKRRVAESVGSKASS